MEVSFFVKQNKDSLQDQYTKNRPAIFESVNGTGFKKWVNCFQRGDNLIGYHLQFPTFCLLKVLFTYIFRCAAPWASSINICLQIFRCAAPSSASSNQYLQISGCTAPLAFCTNIRLQIFRCAAPSAPSSF